MKKRVTLKHIAQVCNCSVNTVSRALKDDPKISVATRELIKETADRLGYMPNLLASTLKSGKGNTIAIIVEDITNIHYSEVISQINSILHSLDYQVVILNPQLHEEYHMNDICLAISYNVVGILFFPFSSNQDIIKPIIQNQIPLVLIEREIHGVSADLVRLDDYQGGYIAGKRLVDAGHKTFLYLAGPNQNGAQPLRQNGFFKALLESNISSDSVRIISYYEHEKALAENSIEDLIQPVDYTAVLSFNDQIAYPVMRSLQNNGYRIPEDISVIGFDHLYKKATYLPAVSSVSYSETENIAQTAVNVLLNRIEKYAAPTQIKILSTQLYEEGTVSQLTK